MRKELRFVTNITILFKDGKNRLIEVNTAEEFDNYNVEMLLVSTTPFFKQSEDMPCGIDICHDKVLGYSVYRFNW